MAESPSPSLAEALPRFLSSLKGKEYQEAQQELSRFVRWCGRDRKVADISPPEVGEYVEWYVGGSVEGIDRLEPIKRFLLFLHRQGLTRRNLSTHVKIARSRRQRRRTTSVKSQPKASLTREGYAQLQSRLEVLREERGKVVKDIQRAMADKDFRENSPLDAAKERQGFIEGHIQELEEVLSTAVVADQPLAETSAPRVSRSCRVIVSDVLLGKQLSYVLVDPHEADPASGKISFASPVGQALLGHSAGDEVSIAVPRGTLRFRIEKVESQSSG